MKKILSLSIEQNIADDFKNVSADENFLIASKKAILALIEKKVCYESCDPLRQIILPAGLSRSIEEKLQAEQESQRMSFILQKETQEAESKRIEAKGIKDFQTIVSEGINDQLLRWKGIEATEKLANSPNSKVVVIGSGKDGLPLILGGNN